MLFGLDAQKLRLCVNCAMHDLHSYAMKTRHSLFRAAGHIIKAMNNAANAAEKGSSIEMRKAKFLLTLAAAAAVMSTAAMSFAQWDTLTATAKGTVTLEKPIVVTASDNTTYTSNSKDTNTGAPIYTGEITVAVEDVPESSKAGVEMQLTPKVLQSDNTDVTGNFTVSLENAGGTLTAVSGVATDSTPKLDGTNNTYTVKLVPNDTEAAKALAGVALKVEVQAELATK